MEAWATALGCSREAVARGVGRLGAGVWKLERVLRARLEGGD